MQAPASEHRLGGANTSSLRAATPDDADDIAAVHVRSWRAAYRDILAPAFLAGLSVARRAAGWREALAGNDSQVLLVREAGRLLGFVSHGPCRDAGAPAGQGEIMAIYVDPPAWGGGIGQRLLGQALSDLQRGGFDAVSLWVMSRNAPARRFYARAGFHEVPGSATTFELGAQPVEEVCYRRALSGPTPGPHGLTTEGGVGVPCANSRR